MLLFPLKQTIYYTSPAGGLSLVLQISLLFGFISSFPVLVYQIYQFVAPVFSKQSKRLILTLYCLSILTTAVGVGFVYYISLPAALFFLQGFSSDQVKSLITTTEYFSFTANYLLIFVIFFHLPLVLLFINYLSPLPIKTLLKKSPYVIIASFILAAILTPTPDPFNQILMAGPIILLYFFSFGIIWVINTKFSLKSLKRLV